jgi:hypothetical protein
MSVSVDFSSIHNQHEQGVFHAVTEGAARFPMIAERTELMADVACVALNRLGPRYIRHEVDFAFFLTERERTENEKALADAVDYAFSFVQARVAMRARA